MNRLLSLTFLLIAQILFYSCHISHDRDIICHDNLKKASDLAYSNPNSTAALDATLTIANRSIYIYVGPNWIITFHSSEVEISSTVKNIIEKKNRKLIVSNIFALYYTIIDEIISRYEQLLTSIEFTVTDFEQKALYKKPSKSMLNYLDVVAKQTIVIRRHFWYTRDAVNFLTHMQNRDDEVRYLQIAYDDIGATD